MSQGLYLGLVSVIVSSWGSDNVNACRLLYIYIYIHMVVAKNIHHGSYMVSHRRSGSQRQDERAHSSCVPHDAVLEDPGHRFVFLLLTDKQALHYLKNLPRGSIIFFDEEKLRDCVVLDPYWLAEAGSGPGRLCARAHFNQQVVRT